MSRNNSKVNNTTTTNNSGLSKPQTVLPAGTANAAADQDPKLHKQNLKNQLSVLKSQQKDIARNIKGIEKQISNLSQKKTNKK